MGMLSDFLAAVDSTKRVYGRKLADLLRDPVGYSQQRAAQITEDGPQALADQLMGLAPGGIPSVGGGMVAQTAWHGSPHKFNKFDLSKIGTGEGAQAYGHGVYLAEAPEVAKSYQASTTKGFGLPAGQNVQGVANVIAMRGEDMARKYYANLGDQLEPTIAKAKQAIDNASSLYKTDIPDEAVARFLDWDKPLSQQAGIQIKPVSPSYNGQFGTGEYGGYAWHVGDTQVSRAYRTPEQAQKSAPLGSDLIRDLNAEVARPTGHQEILQKAGIPGIRYLDGGSRSAGQGSSNFVVFDPDLIRILERNGEATGLQPWKPGEWTGMLDAAKQGTPTVSLSDLMKR